MAKLVKEKNGERKGDTCVIEQITVTGTSNDGMRGSKKNKVIEGRKRGRERERGR